MTRTSLRHLGTCAACGRQIKVRDGKLVHHGYERPGYGYIVGDCFGVGYEPHETSPLCAEKLQALVTTRLQNSREALALSPAKESVLVSKSRFGHPPSFNEVKKGEPLFERYLEAHIERLKSDIRMYERELERLTGLLTDWKATPLITIEEEMAQQRAAKAVREAAKQAKRDAKVAGIIAKLRGRLESASRRKTASVFLTIFENAPGHVEVWQKLGLLTDAGEPVYVRQDGRYVSYSLPHEVKLRVEAAIKSGTVDTLSF